MVHNVVVIATSSVVDWLYFSSHFPVYAGHWNYTNSSGVTIIGTQNAVLYVALSNTAVIKVIDKLIKFVQKEVHSIQTDHYLVSICPIGLT